MKVFSVYSILTILLIIPLTNSIYGQGYDIPDIPNMEDFDIPSPEEIEAMMKATEVSGKYVNSEHGVEVTFPNGWSGMESNFKDLGTNNMITSIAVMEGGMQANMDSMQKGEFGIIVLSIMDKTDDEPPEFEPPTLDEDKEYDVDCKITASEKTKVNNMNTFKSVMECIGDEMSIKGKTHHFSTNDKWIMFAYAVSPSSEFENDVSEYDSSVNTIKISNSIDFDFEIPEDMKSSTDSPSTKSSPIEDVNLGIPGWIKTNAGWWAGDEIDDETFVSGIQFLIKDGILNVPETSSTEPQDPTNEIPTWIKNNAGWWADDAVSDDDFINGIQYLIEQGIIVV